MDKLRYSYKVSNISTYFKLNELHRLVYILPKKTTTICLVLVCIVTVLISPMSTITAVSNSTSHYNLNSISESGNFYLNSINKLRKQKGLKPLDYDYRLEASSLSKAKDMVSNNYWSHVSPHDVPFYNFIWHDKPSAKYAGENLARCYGSAQETFDGLTNSTTHYNVMTNKKFKYFGVSEVINQNEYCIYTVMHFAN
jgi:uncharacterized protein YkwD